MDVEEKELTERGNWECSREEGELLKQKYKVDGKGSSAGEEELASDGKMDNSSIFTRAKTVCIYVHKSM